MSKVKILRITTVPMSLRYLLRGQMRYMNAQGHEVQMASADGPEIADVTSYEGVEHHVFNLTRKITPVQDLRTVFKLRAWLRKEQFDIVHSHTPKAGLVAMMASLLAGTPVRLHTVAGIPWMEATGMKRKLLKTVEKITYRFATKIYFNSEALSRFALDNKLLKAQKLTVIANGSSNGIDTKFFSLDAVPEAKAALRAGLKIPEDALVFCFVGRIVGDKGMNELAQAFNKLEQVQPNTHLLLVGPLEESLDPIANESLEIFKNSSQVHMLGYQSDVRPFYKMSDALVFPSYREGFPNVPLQAGAMGLPSIVTNINGCNEIVSEGVNGLLVPPKQAEDLFHAMQKLSTDSELLKAMSTVARTMIEDRFDQQVIWKALEADYLALTLKR